MIYNPWPRFAAFCLHSEFFCRDAVVSFFFCCRAWGTGCFPQMLSLYILGILHVRSSYLMLCPLGRTGISITSRVFIFLVFYSQHLIILFEESEIQLLQVEIGVARVVWP